MRTEVLNQAGKEELALALILWKDFKCNGKLDIDITMQAMKLADRLGVREEYDRLSIAMPPMKIVERYPG